MTKKKYKFLKILKIYLKMYPEERITQALFNLRVTEKEVVGDSHYFKDNYNQDDETTVKTAKEALEKYYKAYFKGVRQ